MKQTHERCLDASTSASADSTLVEFEAIAGNRTPPIAVRAQNWPAATDGPPTRSRARHKTPAQSPKSPGTWGGPLFRVTPRLARPLCSSRDLESLPSGTRGKLLWTRKAWPASARSLSKEAGSTIRQTQRRMLCGARTAVPLALRGRVDSDLGKRESPSE